MDLLRRDQFDRKIREIEIRSRNIKRRQKREAMWKKKPPGQSKKGATVEELLKDHQQFSDSLKNRKKRAKGKAKTTKRRNRRTSIKNAGEDAKQAKEGEIKAREIKDFTNTQKLDLVKDDDCKEILKVFYAQSKELIRQMRERMSSSQTVLKVYMDRLEHILKGDPREKYLGDEPDPGFIGHTILREQRLKYRKLHCLNLLEKRMGVLKLFQEVSQGAEVVRVAEHNRNLAQSEGLSEEGKPVTRKGRHRGTLGAEVGTRTREGRVRESLPRVQNSIGGHVS